MTGNDKQEIKQAILKVLRAKAGVWLTFDELSSAVTAAMKRPVWQGSFFRARLQVRSAGDQ